MGELKDMLSSAREVFTGGEDLGHILVMTGQKHSSQLAASYLVANLFGIT